MCCQFSAMMVSTYWVNRQCDRIIATKQYEVHDIEDGKCVKISYDVVLHKESVDDEDEDEVQELMLENVVRNDRLIDEFATHLLKEFSAECLLSWIEFNEYRNRVIQEFKLTNRQQMDLAPGVPQSDIVYAKGSSLKESGHKLYEKYIANGSEFEINISGSMRNAVNALMSDHDTWMAMEMSGEDLCDIFDDAIGEMNVLLSHSLQRFQVNLEKPDSVGRGEK